MPPTRRFVPWLFLAVGLVACGGRDEEPTVPNVLLLVMDTTRADHCSVNGYHRDTTPSLVRMARDGTVYTDAWSPTSWTGPAHATLFTGLRPENHGLHSANQMYLGPERPTLAGLLAGRGYATACLTNNPMISSETGLRRGFALYESPAVLGHPEDTSAPWATDRALELAAANHQAGRPFFLFVNDWEPHLPYEPPERTARQFVPADADPARVARLRKFRSGPEDLFEMRFREFSEVDWARLTDLYDAEILTLDLEIGRLIDGLRAAGILEDTLVIVTSDHGENLGDHGLGGHVYSLHRSLRHVPLLIRYPKRFPVGRRMADPVRLEDVFPTVLDVCGVPAPPGLDGRSLLDTEGPRPSRAILDGKISRNVARDHPEFARSGWWRSLRAVYDGRYHLIQAEDGREELYDLLEDPAETRNLVGGSPRLLERLRPLLPKVW